MTRQDRELIDALDLARRCAGRLESRLRLNGDVVQLDAWVCREELRDWRDAIPKRVPRLSVAA